jgi:hypothetical protein
MRPGPHFMVPRSSAKDDFRFSGNLERPCRNSVRRECEQAGF